MQMIREEGGEEPKARGLDKEFPVSVSAKVTLVHAGVYCYYYYLSGTTTIINTVLLSSNVRCI